MKRIILFLGLAVMLFSASLLSGCGNGDGGQKIGVADYSRVLSECESGVEAVAMLNKLNDAMIAELTALKDSLGSEASEENVAVVQQAYAKYQAIIRGASEKIQATMDERFNDVLSEFRKDEGYAMIVPSEVPLSYSAEADITEDLIKAMNKQEVLLDLGVNPEGPFFDFYESESNATDGGDANATDAGNATDGSDEPPLLPTPNIVYPEGHNSTQ